MESNLTPHQLEAATNFWDATPEDERYQKLLLYIPEAIGILSYEVMTKFVEDVKARSEERKNGHGSNGNNSTRSTQPQPYAETPFTQRAKILLDSNIPVVMVAEGGKGAFESGWQNKLISSLDDSRFTDAQYANCNTGAVAQAKVGGFWVLEVDSPEILKKIEADTGHSLKEVPTLVVCSRKDRWHFYFKQTEASMKMGNVPQKYGEFSARVDNMYVVGPNSHRVDWNSKQIIRSPEILERDA